MFGGMAPGLRGSISVVNSGAINTSGPGALFRRPTAASTFSISFTNTSFERVAQCTKLQHGCAKGLRYLNKYLNMDAAPLSIFMDPSKSTVIATDAIVGGISFDNCTVIDDQSRPYFILNATWPDGTENRRLANVRFSTGTVETTSKQSCHAAVASAGTSKLALTPTTCTVRPLKMDDQSPDVLIGAHYFAGWYFCEGRANCTGHISGYTPTGARTASWFDTYPSRIPLLGNLTTDEITVAAELAAADRALDFFDVLFYDAGADCGHNADRNLRYCLDSSLAFMLNSTTIWNGIHRLHFFITYSNDVDRGTPNVFVGATGEAKWVRLVHTWVKAMGHPRYLKVGGRPVFKVLIPSIFITECGQNSTLATRRLAQLTAAAKAAGLQAPLIGGGWQNPSVPAGAANPSGSARPHPHGYMRYNNTNVDCAGGCTITTMAAVSVTDCQRICNETQGCTAITVDYATPYTRAGPPLSCAVLTRAGPGGGNATCDTYVRVPGLVMWDWTGTYNAAPPPDPAGLYTNSWFPNATKNGAKIFPYKQVGDYQGEARTNHSNDRVPYLANVIAGFAPGPWEEHAPSFSFPTQPEWEAVLLKVKEQCADPANRFGFPYPSSPNGFQPAFNIYAWNELGEGGIMTPTRGDGYMKIDTIAKVFNRSRRFKSDDGVPAWLSPRSPRHLCHSAVNKAVYT